MEQLGWPVMFRDPQGVVWALWQNTSRRWAYSARWMGEEFGQVQERRGPFNAPGLPVTAEKCAPAGAGDVGVLFFAAAAGGNNRAIFDRVRIPSLSTAEDREVLFLDSLEVAATTDAEFVLNVISHFIPTKISAIFSEWMHNCEKSRSRPQDALHDSQLVCRGCTKKWESRFVWSPWCESLA